MPKVFIAYPGNPTEIGDVMKRTRETALRERTDIAITIWQRPDLGGMEVIQPVLTAIADCDVFLADITRFNFNVTYELGYAIGLGKRVIPIVNTAFEFDTAESQAIGIFDTLIHQNYSSHADIIDQVAAARTGQRMATDFPYDPLPMYAVLPSVKIDEYAQLATRGRKAGLRTRTFDPNEQTRLGASEAVRAVASSYGIMIPLLHPEMKNAQTHNLRAAFVGGIAHALEKPTLMLKKGDWPAPVDVASHVVAFRSDEGLTTAFTRFAAQVHDLRFASQSNPTKRGSDLANLNLGDPAAENEESSLNEYFLERGEFRQVVDGRASIVVGRKGSGKTAVYVRAREHLKSDRSKVIVDLSPEGYQLKKLKDLILTFLASGSKEFLLSAFWEYVLLLEISAKIIEKDQEVHKRNHLLYEPYQRLLGYFRAEPVTEGIDFSDRLIRLIERMGEKFRHQFGATVDVALTHGQLTNIMHQTELQRLRREIEGYARNKSEVHILFDNIDKGWNASGLEPADLIMVRTLIDAGKKLRNDFGRAGTKLKFNVFLRNDIYDVLLSETPDRGKDTKVLVDWVDGDLLKQLVRRRLIFNGFDAASSIENMWGAICVPLVNGEDSLAYLIRHSLMRPRYLLRLINHCLDSAVNFDRSRVDEDDILKGVSIYSTDVVTEIDLEIRDVLPLSDVLYCLLGERREMRLSEIKGVLGGCIKDEASIEPVFNLLLWHGVLGIQRSGPDFTYIYDVNYDSKRLGILIQKSTSDDPLLQINPAFWPGLELN
ncbi:P-loop ATPase, Sll1717 family [Methylobacterium sp. SI9]|uniref:P-loop ATPase, Sll1717 family n=1 Tax=Methylobacterium guangdongense TaxID=3138811 RepID=UPI00313BC1CA